MIYKDEDKVPISAITHLAFCPRRCALVHIEGLWAENCLTSEGDVLHERAHSGAEGKRDEIITARSLRIHSAHLGISGITDVIEFHQDDAGVPIFGHRGKWRPCPVEYKRGAAKNERPYQIQLCAQAMCLEEMYNTKVTFGHLYIGVEHKREVVHFDDSLRSETMALCSELHKLFDLSKTPSADYSEKCRSCSLMEMCRPREMSRSSSARCWIQHRVDEVIAL